VDTRSARITTDPDRIRQNAGNPLALREQEASVSKQPMVDSDHYRYLLTRTTEEQYISIRVF
jgi:hypothetical protein